MRSTLALTTALIPFVCAGPAWTSTTGHTRVFTASGTFTVPSNIVTSSEFQFTVVGGGGGAGGCTTTTGSAGGGSGGTGFASFTGFHPADKITITIGNGGAGGSTTPTAGSNGASSKVTYSDVNIVTATGGGGSPIASTSTSIGGSAGTFVSEAGSTPLTRASNLSLLAQDGVTSYVTGTSNFFAIPGGGNPVGHSGTYTNPDGMLGGGGLGCWAKSAAGGNGGSGVVIIKWSP